MNKIIRIYRWIIISIILQLIFLFIINNFYLAGEKGSIQAVMFDETGTATVKDGVEISAGAVQISVSYDKSYCAYILNGKLEYIDLKKNGIKKSIAAFDGADYTISYFKWLPDRNMIIYSLRLNNSELTTVHVLTYDLDTAVKRDYPEIANLPKGSETTSIELSPLTNIVYVKVRTSDTRSRIYKYNIMDKLTHIMTTDASVIIRETNYSDNLIYQGSSADISIRYGKNGTAKRLLSSKKAVLLDIDSEDNIYVGELNSDNKVVSIRFGKLSKKPDSEWEQIMLEDAVPTEDIVASSNGKLFVLLPKENIIYSIDDKIKVPYKGQYIEVFQDYVVSFNEGKLIFNPMKK